MNLEPDHVAALIRHAIEQHPAMRKAERARDEARWELQRMNVFSGDYSDHWFEQMLEWAERGCPDEDEPAEMDRAA